MSQHGGAKKFTLPRWMRNIEHVWRHDSTGYILITAAVVICVWFHWSLPPSGYAVTAMAVAAGVMAIRPKMGGWEQSLWFVLLIFFAIVEIRAINKDRGDQTNRFGAIASGLTAAINGLDQSIKENRTHFDETVGTITGGDAYCWARASGLTETGAD